MKKLFIILFLISGFADAAYNRFGIPFVTPTNGDCLVGNGTSWNPGSCSGGGGGTPGGTSGQVQYNNSGAFGGDLCVTDGSGNLSCASYTDSGLTSGFVKSDSGGLFSSGAIAGSDLPNPSAASLGGVQSKAAVSHNFLTAISTSGVPAAAQPAFTDISGTAGVAQGGTGATSFTAYAVLAGGTTSTGPVQNVVALGTSGTVLTSNGPGALPSFQAAGGGGAVGPGPTTTVGALTAFLDTGGQNLQQLSSCTINSRGTGLLFAADGSGADNQLQFHNATNAIAANSSDVLSISAGVEWQLGIATSSQVSFNQYGAGTGNLIYWNYPFNWSVTQTTTACNGAAGTFKWSQPYRGSSEKKFIGFMSGCTAAAQTINFPSAFTNTPYCYGDAAAVTTVTPAASGLTFTSTTATGNVICEGF